MLNIKVILKEAMDRFEIAKKQKNFYANALIAELYINGFGVEMNDRQAISLLEDAKDLDQLLLINCLYFI